MTTLEKLECYQEYLNYLRRHLENVNKAWDILKIALKNESFIYDDFKYWELNRMIEMHDYSKLSKEEFTQYAEYFFNPLGSKKDSFNNTEDWQEKEHSRIIKEFGEAWEHHKEHNEHHWEHWTKRKGTDYQALCVVTMVADWMAMGMEFGDTAEKYYLKNAHKIDISDWSRDLLLIIFKCLRDYEKEC